MRSLQLYTNNFGVVLNWVSAHLYKSRDMCFHGRDRQHKLFQYGNHRLVKMQKENYDPPTTKCKSAEAKLEYL